jgi:hypothetical protein
MYVCIIVHLGQQIHVEFHELLQNTPAHCPEFSLAPINKAMASHFKSRVGTSALTAYLVDRPPMSLCVGTDDPGNRIRQRISCVKSFNVHSVFNWFNQGTGKMGAGVTRIFVSTHWSTQCS